MTRLENFFHGTDSKFGIFYPSNCVIAVFPDFSAAARARDRLHFFGFSETRMVAVPGDDLVAHNAELQERGGVWGHLMARLSRLVGTEALPADEDLQLAKGGCAFLAVRTPTRESKEVACALLEATRPILVHFYSIAGIELVGGAEALRNGFGKHKNN